VAQIFPANWQEQLLWLGFRGEVWIEPGQPASQGSVYRQPHAGRVALVLGAGNNNAIAPMDVLHKLFVEGDVVILKMNPVNDYLGQILAQALHPLIRDGFLGILSGDGALGNYLCHHPLVESIHITGSHHTHDAIVWGATASEQEQRKATGQPLLTKPISSELGCVTPVLIVPGPWSQADLIFQARHLASMITHNASFNCVAPQVLVMAQGWAQRQAFLDLLRQRLATCPPRKAFYPGANHRYQVFLDHYPQAEVLGSQTCTSIPWTLIPNVPPRAGELAFSEEAFCGLVAEVSLAGADPAEFLQQAVEFANDKIWGSLSCVVVIDPLTQKRMANRLDQAIADLRYGAIGINVWTGVITLLGVHPWGAFPGNLLCDIRSGQGFVHNTFLFDHPEKTVLKAPFRIWPTPIWFTDHRNLLRLSQTLLAYEADPSWFKVPSVMGQALQG
jgi:acyl-CoA reductase-like NAD-dependent aldehyde dehydrogenase